MTGQGSLEAAAAEGRHFSCSMTAVLIDRVRREVGESGVGELLSDAGSNRSLEYLEDIGNWISYDEAISLWQAGKKVTGDPQFPRHAGEDTVRKLGSSSTSTVLRSLGSPEALVRQLTVATSRFSAVAELEATELRPGYAEVRAAARAGFRRDKLHCEWTTGLLTQVSVLFGMPPAEIEHLSCQAEGAEECRYIVRWKTEAEHESDPEERLASLQAQLEAMSERLENVFATAADLIDSGNLDETLARITDRAALQVRAPRYLLAVRPASDAELHLHYKGLEEEEGRRIAEQVLGSEGTAHPDNWLVAPVSSHRNEYGSLVAIFEPESKFFPQERQLLEVYARYAATALDSAGALQEAKARHQEAQRRYEESHALLELARRLATAGNSQQVAQRLAEAVPAVIDCDRVSVFLWNEDEGEFQRCALSAAGPLDETAGLTRIHPEQAPRLAQLLDQPNPEPLFIDLAESPLGAVLREMGAVACVAVPIATKQRLLGCIVVAVGARPERLAPSQELRDRLSGVAAHAVTALENGHLVDHITYQASHDQLTGLVNRMGFNETLAEFAERASEARTPLGLFYVDLDGFKSINDEFGHEVGDDLLRVVAERLVERVRPGDVVARLGGDEFAVLAAGVGKEQIAAIAARLEHAFDDPLAVGARRFGIRASIGCAVWPTDVGEHQALLRHADGEMYDVKRARQLELEERGAPAGGSNLTH
jgi:diguanylate cyclase (GGDEF)-like protein